MPKRVKKAYRLQPTGRVGFTDDSAVPASVAGGEISPNEKLMSLGDHLEELRRRILWIAAILTAAGIGAFTFSDEIHLFLTAPYRKITDLPLLLGGVFGPMEVIVELSLLVAFIGTLPFLVIILWQFITPALETKAARIGYLIIFFSTILFWGGVAFCYIYLFPISLEMMMMNFLPPGTSPQVTLEKYYSFLFLLHLGCGLLFQIPILIIALGATGLVPIQMHKKTWRYVVVGVFVFAALITPPDPISMTVLAAPLLLLYAFAIGVVALLERRLRRRYQEIDEMETILAGEDIPVKKPRESSSTSPKK